MNLPVADISLVNFVCLCSCSWRIMKKRSYEMALPCGSINLATVTGF